jgi:hypothetical protein
VLGVDGPAMLILVLIVVSIVGLALFMVSQGTR